MSILIPKTYRTYQKRLDEAFQKGYDDGFGYGKAYAEREYKAKRKDLVEKRVVVHMQALEVLIKLGHAHGQLMEQVNKAMQSEKDQL